jgi:hypothetical protein
MTTLNQIGNKITDGINSLTLAESGVATTLAGTETLTNKSISGATNTLSAIPGSAINDASVTYAKIQNISATDLILGRSSAGAGVTQEIACTASGRAMIAAASAAAQAALLGLNSSLNFYDAVVDGVGTNPSSYSTVSAAVGAGKKYINVISNTTETADIVLGSFCFVYANSGVTIDLGTHKIDCNSADNIIFSGFNQFTSTIKFSPSSNSNIFINTSSSNLVVIINNFFIDFSAMTATVANFNVSTDGSSFIFKNVTVKAGGGHNQIWLNGANNPSYIENISYIGTGGSSNTLITLNNGAYAEGLQYSGTFNPSISLLDIYTGSSVNNVYINAATAINVFLYEGSLTNISGSAATAYGYVIAIYGGTDGYVLANGTQIYALYISGSSIGTISNCSSISFYPSTYNLPTRTGNNSVIGNDYQPLLIPSTTVGSAYTANQWNQQIQCDTTTYGPVTITLPDATSAAGQLIYVSIINGVGGVTINASGGQNILTAAGYASNVSMLSLGSTWGFMSDGGNVTIISAVGS